MMCWDTKRKKIQQLVNNVNITNIYTNSFLLKQAREKRISYSYTGLSLVRITWEVIQLGVNVIITVVGIFFFHERNVMYVWKLVCYLCENIAVTHLVDKVITILVVGVSLNVDREGNLVETFVMVWRSRLTVDLEIKSRYVEQFVSYGFMQAHIAKIKQ